MRGKLALLAGVSIGYVLGARAGRERYEDIKVWARKFWNNPGVQRQVHEAGQFAKDKAPDVAQFLSESAKKVVSRRGKAASQKPESSASRFDPSTSASVEADE